MSSSVCRVGVVPQPRSQSAGSCLHQEKERQGKAPSPRSSCPRHPHHFLITASMLLCPVPVCDRRLAPSVCIKRFPRHNLLERQEKCYWLATPTEILCPGCSPVKAGTGPSLRAPVIRLLHKPLSAVAHILNCTHKALEGPQDGFQQYLHRSVGFSIAHL